MILHGLVKKQQTKTAVSGKVHTNSIKTEHIPVQIYHGTNKEIKKKPISTDNGHSVIQVSVPFILVENITGT